MRIFSNRKARTKLQQQKDHALNMLLLKIAIVAVATTIVVYFLPRTGGFNYLYELNQPWRYGAMISTQKFNIQMSDSVLDMKKDSLSQNFMPYFVRDIEIEAKVKANILNLEGDRKLKQHVVEMLDSVFERGIMPSADLDSLKALGTPGIRMIAGNEAVVVPLGRVMSMHEAYQFIMHHDEDTFKPIDLSHLNINTELKDNLAYEQMKSEEELENEYEQMATSLGFVRINEKIVDRGEIVTEEIFQKLKSYENVMNRQQTEESGSSLLLWGQIGIVLIIMSILATYLTIFRPDYLDKPRHVVLLYLLIVFFSVFASVMVSRHLFHVYILPICMVPIIIRVFLDSRTAFAFHVGMVLLISLSLNNPYEYMLLQLIMGLVVILNLRELTQRSQIVKTSIIVTIAYCVVYSIYQFASGAELQDLDRRIFIYFCINGLLLLFTYPLFWIMERLFGFVSDVTLVELSNINHPLLQKMSAEAPGTFQHSMQVANLASEVAKKIGAKAQLVRTGALYHDIGKLERPAFFTENQAGGNPHKHLTPIKSAEVIISHVQKGLALAEKYTLPEQIKGFISTHHGTGKTKYFLVTYQNEHPDEPVDESLFTYPGPNPVTKEEAILMMADAVEASSRSLTEYTEEAIGELVEKIVNTQVSEGYFKKSSITFKDVDDAKEIFKEKLKVMYHTRISYPELNKNAAQDNKTTKNQL